MSVNPWDVDYLEDFLVFCCPECQELNQNKEDFLEHALESHPSSKPSLLRFLMKQEMDTHTLDFSDLKAKLKNAFKPKVKSESNGNYYMDDSYDQDEQDNSYDNYDVVDGEDFEVKDTNFPCSYCNTTFHSERYLKIHTKMCKINKDEFGNTIAFNCHLCDRVFSDRNSKDKHVRIDHKGKQLICTDCNKEFETESGLSGHKKYHCEKLENKPNLSVVCDTCGKSLSNPHSLKLHIASAHASDIDKNFQCDECDKRFVANYQLVAHKKSKHLGIKPEKNQMCSQCDYRCSSSDFLQQHIAAVHEGKKDYKCEFCSKTFSFKSSVKSHIKIVHKNERKFVCDECGNRYTNRITLQNHIDAIHKQVRKWNCEFCGKTYAHKEGLRVHVQTIHEGIRYFCFRCNKSFTQLPNLKKHVKEAYNMDYQEYLEAKERASVTS